MDKDDRPNQTVPFIWEHGPNMSLKDRFVRAFLISAGLILGMTALGKAIPAPLTKCIEPPILGPYQPDVSNQTILFMAAAIEFGILGLICFCRKRWLPCLACSLWGGLCLLVHAVALGSDTLHSCNCLGSLQGVIPLPEQTLPLCAAWLTVGGFVGFCWSWQRTIRSLLLLLAAIAGLLMSVWYSIPYYRVYPDHNEGIQVPLNPSQILFNVMSGGFMVLSLCLYFLLRKQRAMTARSE